jgi:carbamoyl-phosphate synthase/aspartate carbamoyltransferase
VIGWIKDRKIDLVINIAEGSTKSAADEITSGYIMRRTAVDFGVSLITNIK